VNDTEDAVQARARRDGVVGGEGKREIGAGVVGAELERGDMEDEGGVDDPPPEKLPERANDQPQRSLDRERLSLS